jgi:hypothetical protein
MALDFTQIKDQPGAAIFFMHDGTEQDRVSMLELVDAVRSKTNKQAILLSAKDTIGMAISQFYGLRGTHYVLVVRDDDQLHHVWSDGELFDPSTIAYIADQAG